MPSLNQAMQEPDNTTMVMHCQFVAVDNAGAGAGNNIADARLAQLSGCDSALPVAPGGYMRFWSRGITLSLKDFGTDLDALLAIWTFRRWSSASCIWLMRCGISCAGIDRHAFIWKKSLPLCDGAAHHAACSRGCAPALVDDIVENVSCQFNKLLPLV